MNQFYNINVKLSNLKLNKLKSAFANNSFVHVKL